MVKVHVLQTQIVPYNEEYHRGEFVEMPVADWERYQRDSQKMLDWEQHVLTVLRPAQDKKVP